MSAEIAKLYAETELEKYRIMQDMPFDLIRLLHEGVITVGDLEDFSDELKENINFLRDRLS